MEQLMADTHGTTLSVKAPDAAQIDILPFPKKIVGSYRPFPFKGKARMGMGYFATFNPIPTSRDTLLAQPAVCGSGCEAAIPAPDASQRRVMAATPTLPLKGRGFAII